MIALLGLPGSADRWRAAAWLALGAWFGFWVNPRSWPALHGPFRAAAIALGQAAAESDFVVDVVKAEGNGTRSVGLLMYNDRTADGDPLPTTADYEWRACAFCAGFRFPEYIGAAVTHRPTWAIPLALPIPIAWAWFRWVHRHGFSDSSWADATVATVYSEARAEDADRCVPRALAGMLTFRALLAIPSLLTIQLAAVILGIRLARSR